MGYGGVIGIMWSINDHVAPLVAEDVDERPFRTGLGATPDHQEAVKALSHVFETATHGSSSGFRSSM